MMPLKTLYNSTKCISVYTCLTLSNIFVLFYQIDSLFPEKYCKVLHKKKRSIF